MAIRTAILGYGRSGSSLHAGPIEASDAFEMVAVCDIDPERQTQATERFGCAIYDDYHAMLSEQPLDLVVVVTRSDQHCRMTCDCLAAGVNVVVTKPWCVNEAEVQRMVAAAEASGKLLLPWLPRPWGTDLRRLRELVQEGAIGNVFLVRHTVCSFGTRCDWQTESKYGGGYLLNWGPHVVDKPLMLVGSKAASVYGRMAQTINPGDTEDIFLAVITTESGTVIKAEYTVAVESLPGWFIQGDRGTIIANGRDIRILKKTPPQPADPTKYKSMAGDEGETIEESVEGAIYGDQNAIYAEIAAAITGEATFPVAPADALELTRVLDAVRISNAENRVVTLT